MRIRFKRKLSAVWVTGSMNHKRSNITDHSKSEQYVACMAYMCANSAKARHEPVESLITAKVSSTLLAWHTCVPIVPRLGMS